MATQNVSEEQLQSQFTYIDAVARLLGDKRPKAYTHTFGCQQNEADTERIRGMLSEMGYEMTDTPDEADFILFNTCAVREHAEDRAFGNVGALRHLKKERPGIVIAMCGCMAQQEKNVEKIKKSYPQVNLLYRTHALWRFPSLLYRVLTEKKRVFDIGGEDDIAEGLPVLRAKGAKAWLSIMYGCNNFCTYCIVPYVRGRERSRRPEEIEKELRELVAAGYKEITLLGQNVNSYGKDLGIDVDFADLLRRLNAVPGDFWLRFMTSHPKDASPKLFSAMAECNKVAKQLHLPFQSGSDEILHRMNRRYTAEHYKSLIADARSKMPDITLSSDLIVGFPGETEENFEDTLKLVQDTRFDLLFTFLYSPRPQHPMKTMPRRRTSSADLSVCLKRRMKSLPKSRRRIRVKNCVCLWTAMPRDRNIRLPPVPRATCLSACAVTISRSVNLSRQRSRKPRFAVCLHTNYKKEVRTWLN